MSVPVLSRRSNATKPEGFYGWRIVGYAALAFAATGPGQTAGVSLFVDPLIRDLGISRSAVSTAYLIGTLAGALALPWVGRALDRYGVRRTMAVIGAASAGCWWRCRPCRASSGSPRASWVSGWPVRARSG